MRTRQKKEAEMRPCLPPEAHKAQVLLFNFLGIQPDILERKRKTLEEGEVACLQIGFTQSKLALNSVSQKPSFNSPCSPLPPHKFVDFGSSFFSLEIRFHYVALAGLELTKVRLLLLPEILRLKACITTPAFLQGLLFLRLHEYPDWP